MTDIITGLAGTETEAIGVDSSPGVSASFAIRDILPLIARANLSTPVKEISSQLMSVDAKTSVIDVFDYMLNKNIRNIGIKKLR